MKKITTLLFALIAVFSLQAQVVNVCGTDSIVLQVENYDGRGVIEWQESIDSIDWVTIPEFVGETYKFFPTESKYYRAVVKTSDCQPLYSAITLVQIPPVANAGIDRSIGTASMSLLANYIPGAVGEWTILSGNGGNLENRSYHKSVLTGVNNETYKLKWTLTNACGQSSDTVQISFNQLDAITNFIVVDNTDSILSDSTQIANGVYRIKFSDPNISPVDSVILIGMRQDISFLRKVISFTLQDSVYTFITEQGSLQDLFKSGVVNIGDAVNKSLTSASFMSKIKGVDAFPTRQTLLANKNSNDIQMLYVSSSNNKGIQMVKGSKSEIDESPFVLKMDDQTLFKNEDESFKFSIKNAYIKVTPRFLFDFKYDFPFSVSDIKIGVDNAEFEFNMGTEMVCSKAVNFSPLPKKLPIIDHHLYFSIGVIPVDVLVKFDINATSNFYAGGAIKYEQNKNIIQNLTAIATEDRDNNYNLVLITPEPKIKNTESFSTKAEINANVKIGPKISFLVYGIAGPYLDFYTKLNATGCINSNLNWNVNASVGFESNLGLQGDIIIKKTFLTPELKLKLFNYTYPLFDDAFKKTIKFPYKLEYLSGNFQKGKSGAELSNPVKLKVVSDWGFGVPFIPVRFTTETGNGTVSHPVIFTDANGEVSNYWTLGPNAENMLKVSVQDCNDHDIEDSPSYMYASNSVPIYGCSNSSLSINIKSENGYMYPFASGGTKPYTYSVNGVDFSSEIPQFNTLIPRKCVVYVKDQNDCIRSRTFKIKFVNTCATNNLVLTVLSQPNVLTASVKGGKSPYLFTVDNISDFSTKYIYNNLTPGIHTVYVMDANGCTVSRSITIDDNTKAAIKAVYPQNGATYIPLTGINFKWVAATYATNQLYDLFLKKGNDEYTLIASNLSSPSYLYTSTLLASTGYTWKVAVKSGSTILDYAEFTFTTASGLASTPAVPVLLQPESGASVYSPATFKWTPQAGDFKYDLYLDTNNALTLVAMNLTSAEYTVSKLTSGKTYYWKVKIKSTITGATATSAVWSFKVLNASTTVTDIDGNIYHTVTIGTQTWMMENLKTTKYKDGTAIPNVTDQTTWLGLTTDAYCCYNNYAATNKNKYGCLYNWYAVNTGKLAPKGWHVPSDAEWTTLENYLIANGYNYDGTTTGNKIAKSLAATTDWYSSNYYAAIGNDLTKNNSSGFTTLPGGYRFYDGTFYDIGYYSYLWSSSENITSYAWHRYLGYDYNSLNRSYEPKSSGFSVRCIKDETTNPLNIETTLIPAGTFTMGSPETEVDRRSDETQHQVTLSAFRMSKYEITNAQFAAFLNSGYSSGQYAGQPLTYASYVNLDWGLRRNGTQWIPAAGYENHPVIEVTWYGAAEYANWVGGTLPTEAQWEYACRAETTTPFNTGSCLSNVQANYNWNYPYNTCSNTSTTYPNRTQPIGSYAPNAFGLYDMHGNVWEWCADWYGEYPTTDQTNPTGATTGTRHVLRGGCWSSDAKSCRSSNRSGYPYNDDHNIGFRVVFVP